MLVALPRAVSDLLPVELVQERSERGDGLRGVDGDPSDRCPLGIDRHGAWPLGLAPLLQGEPAAPLLCGHATLPTHDGHACRDVSHLRREGSGIGSDVPGGTREDPGIAPGSSCLVGLGCGAEQDRLPMLTAALPAVAMRVPVAPGASITSSAASRVTSSYSQRSGAPRPFEHACVRRDRVRRRSRRSPRTRRPERPSSRSP